MPREILVLLAALGTFWLGSAPAFAQSQWHEARSDHFIIYADQDPELLKGFVTRLEKFDKAVRHVRGMSDPKLSDANKLTVYALAGDGAVGRLAGSSSVGGFYIGRASGSIAVVPRMTGRAKKDKQELDPQTVFFHEYAHHLHRQSTSAALPGWLTEGLAEFFATAIFEKDGSVLLGAPALHRGWGLFNLKDLTLEEMLSASYRKLSMFEVETIYGRGWLLAHYLTFEPTRAGQLDRYVAAIQQGQPASAAATSAFGDLKALDRELERYLRAKTIKTFVVSPAKLAVGEIAIRPLRRGEIAIMGVRLRSERGVSARTAPGVAADARRIAQEFPNDPAVHVALAEAEYDAENYTAAEAAADRALAIQPDKIKALLYKGRVRLDLARKAPATADWKEVRRWFTRANRLDPNNPEPLYLFYLSNLYAGVAPTRNAIEGLYVAAENVPQDDEVRMLAVRQLLTDRNIDRAKQMFGPLAFNPHSGEEWREMAGKAMAAMSAGNADGAQAIFTEWFNRKDKTKD